MGPAEATLREIVRSAAMLLPAVTRAVERCRTDPDPRQDLARSSGALIDAFGTLRDELADLARTPLVERVDVMLYLEQRILAEARQLAFTPRTPGWHRLAQAFGDGQTEGADELLALAARL